MRPVLRAIRVRWNLRRAQRYLRDADVHEALAENMRTAAEERLTTARALLTTA